MIVTHTRRLEMLVFLSGLLSAMTVPTPLNAQACTPLAPGDSVRVTRTFWTPRPEFQMETRSQQIEFGQVTALEVDALRYEVDGTLRAAQLGDSVSVARRCLVRPANDISTARHVFGGGVVGAGIGLLAGLCGVTDLDAAFDRCDRGEDRNIAALMALGLAVGMAVGLVVGIVRREGPQWEWVEGTGHPEVGGFLRVGLHAPGSDGRPVWRFGVTLRR